MVRGVERIEKSDDSIQALLHVSFVCPGFHDDFHCGLRSGSAGFIELGKGTGFTLKTIISDV